MPKIKEPRKSNLGFRRVGIKVSEDYHFDPESENEPKPSMSGIHFSSGSYRLHKGFDRPDEVKPFGYKRDILFGEKGSRSTGHLKDF